MYDDDIFAPLCDSAAIAKAVAVTALEAATSRHRDDGSGGGSAGSSPPSAEAAASASVRTARCDEANPPPTSPSRRGGDDDGGTPVEAAEADATGHLACAAPPPRSFSLRARRARAVAKVAKKKVTSAAVPATGRRVAGMRVAPPKRARPPPAERPGVAEERAERARASPPPRTLHFGLGCAAGGDAEGAAQVRGVVVAGGCDLHRRRLGKFGRRFPGVETHCADARADHGKAMARWIVAVAGRHGDAEHIHVMGTASCNGTCGSNVNKTDATYDAEIESAAAFLRMLRGAIARAIKAAGYRCDSDCSVVSYSFVVVVVVRSSFVVVVVVRHRRRRRLVVVRRRSSFVVRRRRRHRRRRRRLVVVVVVVVVRALATYRALSHSPGRAFPAGTRSRTRSPTRATAAAGCAPRSAPRRARGSATCTFPLEGGFCRDVR